MKQYRCPHCGEKAFTTSDHIYMGLVSMVSTSRYATNSKCSRCNNRVHAAWHYGRALWIILGVLAIYCIFQAVSFLAFSNVRQALHWGVAVACGIYAVAFVITAVISALKKPLVRYNPNEWGMGKYSMPLPNTRIKVNSDNYLKPYRVYGLKFKFDNGDGGVKEVFKDGMVPMALHPIKTADLTYDVAVYSKDALPQDIFEVGRKFLVEDADGIFIAKGTIEKSELDY